MFCFVFFCIMRTQVLSNLKTKPSQNPSEAPTRMPTVLFANHNHKVIRGGNHGKSILLFMVPMHFNVQSSPRPLLALGHWALIEIRKPRHLECNQPMTHFVQGRSRLGCISCFFLSFFPSLSIIPLFFASSPWKKEEEIQLPLRYSARPFAAWPFFLWPDLPHSRSSWYHFSAPTLSNMLCASPLYTPLLHCTTRQVSLYIGPVC
ncbi:hypothetical protein GGI35DRAFT_122755 [Trichoderma velutinum]